MKCLYKGGLKLDKKLKVKDEELGLRIVEKGGEKMGKMERERGEKVMEEVMGEMMEKVWDRIYKELILSPGKGERKKIRERKEKVEIRRRFEDGWEGVWERVVDLNKGGRKKKGKSMMMSEILYGKEWGRLSREVKEERGMKCELCGKEGWYDELNVHHIIPILYWVRNINWDGQGRPWNNKNNLMVLCKEHHALMHPHLQGQ